MAFPAYSIIDDGSRTENPIVGPWTVFVLNIKEGSGVITADADSIGICLTANTTSADCEMRATVRANPTLADSFQLLLRYDDGFVAGTAYRIYWQPTALDLYTVSVSKVIAGVDTTLFSQSLVSLAVGDEAGVDVIGDTITAYVNGASVLSGAGGSAATSAGGLMLLVNHNVAQLDEIGGGPFATSSPATGMSTQGGWQTPSPIIMRMAPRMRASGSEPNPVIV